MGPSTNIPGTREVVDAWAVVQEGRPAVLRFAGDPSGILDAWGQPIIPDWRVDQLPIGGEVLWFEGGPASEAAADIAIAAAVVLQLPTLIVVSGAASERGVGFGTWVEASAAGAAKPTSVHGFEVPDGGPALEAMLVEEARHGRLVRAAALLRVLDACEPERAAAHRWIHIARSFYLTRPDTMDVVRSVLKGAGGNRSRVLTMAAQAAMDAEVSLHLLRQAVHCAETEEDRADARYYQRRTEIRVGQRAVRDAGLPGHPLYVAMARFSTGSREAYRLKSPGPEHAALAAIGTDAAEALLGWVSLRYDVTGADWEAAARRLLVLGLVRPSAWMLSESMQYDPQYLRLGDGLATLDAPRLTRVLELTRVLAGFDAVRARRLVPALVRNDNNVGVRCYGRVLDAASSAILDGDDAALHALHRPEIREQLQPSFCTILADAAMLCTADLKAQMLAVALDWSVAVASLADQRIAWVSALEELGRDALAHIPLGPYSLTRALNSGSMGSVWSGSHGRLGQAVAVKFLKPDAIAHADAFVEEVAVLASLDHPAVVQVLDVGEVSEATEALTQGDLVAGTPYLVMELVSGGTLNDYRGQLGWSDVRDLLLALLDALAYVHARGILHRDLKPANVLVGISDSGFHVRLSDFGLSGRAMHGRVAGTPMYMAPEQFTGQGLGPWTDLYAVGCIATALLTGLPPFLGSVSKLRRAHLQRPVPPLETQVPVPKGFEAWRQRLLAKAPEDRFAHAREASVALLALPGVTVSPTVFEGGPAILAPTFPLETLVGEGVFEPTAQSLGSSFHTELPREGFVGRPLRARLPTDRLFGRFPTPCLGQIPVRQAIWDTARKAYKNETIETLEIRVPAGLSLAPVLSWARRRLRELGVDVAADDRADFQLGEQPPQRAPGLWVRAVDQSGVSLARLDPLQTVAQLRLQVNLTPTLAWTLAGRTHGLPDLIDAVLAEVIRHPGLISTDTGLAACGALPDRFAAEVAWSEQMLAQLSPEAREAVERAAIAPPDSLLDTRGVPDALWVGPPDSACLVPGFASVVADDLLDASRVEALHRSALSRSDCDGFVAGWHLLGIGEPEKAEPLLRAALPRSLALAPLQRCLDLQLVPAEDPRRPRGPVVTEERVLPSDTAPVVQLEWLTRRGRTQGVAPLVRAILEERSGQLGAEYDVLKLLCVPEGEPGSRPQRDV